MFYILTLLSAFIFIFYTTSVLFSFFFLLVHSVLGGQQPDHIPAALLGLVLLSGLHCAAVYSTV